RRGTRLRTGIVVESGEPREVHHIACLLGYGASAVNPYLLFESLPAMVEEGELPGMTGAEAAANVVAGIGKGLLKVLSKMGISTVQSYTGAQIFDAVGLDPELVDRHFHGTASRIGGVGLGLLRCREAPEPIPLDEVEPAAEIVKRFATGAMSLGSISPEAHETLAIAMNRIGGRSNSGEGGEDPRRLIPDPNGDQRRSGIRQ